jgi:DNA polymerase III epsilon subunit-like protein
VAREGWQITREPTRGTYALSLAGPGTQERTKPDPDSARLPSEIVFTELRRSEDTHGRTTSFTVIDVETANADLSSICQIGIVKFVEGESVDPWEQLVDPEDFFDPFNSTIHGIAEEDVLGAPTFADLFAEVERRLSRTVVVSHTHFDRVALEKASEKYGLSFPGCTWLDSARVVRRAWPERYARSGYGTE